MAKYEGTYTVHLQAGGVAILKHANHSTLLKNQHLSLAVVLATPLPLPCAAPDLSLMVIRVAAKT